MDGCEGGAAAPTCTEVKIKQVDFSFFTLALAPVANKRAAGSLKGRSVCCRSIQPVCSGNTRGGPRLHPSTPAFMPSQRTEPPLTQSVSLQWRAVGCVRCLARHVRGIPCHCRHGYCPGATESRSTRRCRSSSGGLWCLRRRQRCHPPRDNYGPLPPSG